MAFEVIISAEAATEIEDAIDWYHKISPDLAIDLFDKYVETRKLLAANPQHFKSIKVDIEELYLSVLLNPLEL